MAVEELWQALLPVLDALDGLGARHQVGGSLASSFAGVSRATQDVDVLAELRSGSGEPLAAMLEPSYYADSEALEAGIRRAGSFNVLHYATGFKVDVFVAGDAFARECLSRTVTLAVPSALRDIPFCSPEDIVLQKLRWFRDGGCASERQWQDVQGVLRLQGARLDDAHLDRWADVLGLADLLGRARAEAGPFQP